MIETGIFRFFNFFSKIWKTNDKYNANGIRERAEPWPTPMSKLKKRKDKLFQNTLSFYLLDNFGKIERSWNQIQLCPRLVEVIGDWEIGKTMQYQMPKY